MSQTASTEGLHTTVKNTSGAVRTYGFLGTHGKRLAANERFTQPGDLVAKLGASKYQRQFKALERSLKTGSLSIVASPAIYLYDEEEDETRELALQGGLLGTVDPAWDSAGSSNFADG
jgi:hypothetical protein